MKTSTIVISVAVLWIVSLVTLFVGFGGSELFDTVSGVTSILAGIGMFALVWNLNGPPSAEQNTLKLTFGILGAVVYTMASVLVLVDFRSFDELSVWIMGGTGIYGIWMILASNAGATALMRGLGIAVGFGFVLLAISVASIGTLDPTSQIASDTNQAMVLAQFVGGSIAYFGFPFWLVLLARTVR